MAYTPVGWQTGDTITADRLNKMDNGWGVENTQLFSETVTTESDPDWPEDPPAAQLAYSNPIDADSLIVSFDGTEYVCPRIDKNGFYYYGGFSEQGATFTEYPFCIASTLSNNVFTETAGTHTVAASVSSLQTSADFDKAVSAAIGGAFYPLVLGTTTWRQVVDAMVAGKLVIFSWGNDSRTTPDTGCTFIELVTETYINSNGNYCVSAITTNKGVQSISTYQAASQTDALELVTS